MRKPLVAGNWKMHGSMESIAALIQDIQAQMSPLADVELAVFPPFVYLNQCASLLASVKESEIKLGAQNVSQHESGAFTGQVSAAMLADIHCHYVIIGHSERRQCGGETNEVVARKVQVAMEHNLIPIICVGESLETRESGKTLAFIAEQLAAVLSLAHNLRALESAVVAYEPIWAIGTGKTASPEQAQEVHQAIRQQLTAHDDTLSNVRIIYGGSVKPDNAGALFAMPDIDGALVGGASLDAQQFSEIAKQCNNYY